MNWRRSETVGRLFSAQKAPAFDVVSCAEQSGGCEWARASSRAGGGGPNTAKSVAAENLRCGPRVLYVRSLGEIRDDSHCIIAAKRAALSVV
jgi:hypothetical protein